MQDAISPERWLARRARMRERHGTASDSGLPLGLAVRLLPTPTASEASGPGRIDGPRADTLRSRVRLLKTPTAQLGVNGGTQHPDKRKAGGHGPTLADEVEHLLPTPRASDGTKGSPNQHGSKGDLTLSSAAYRIGAPMARRSRGGRSSPVPLPGQLTIEDA
ncbi:hypothetical protein GCM10009760_18740 [Kitasatospora kazusensis]|uniref:Uncharacterized protein n=1 Tax=Kitasatospora kazusensis TaxID=407974 RepID=A0ABN2Z7D6_9ACTN